MKGTVKWFSAEKATALLKEKKAATFSFISLLFRLMASKH